MDRFKIMLFILACAALFTQCQRELSIDRLENDPRTPASAPVTAQLQGNMLNETGQPAAGVIVTVGDKFATTDAAGYFRLEDAPLDKKASLVTASLPGYFKAYRVFAATNGVNRVIIKLIKKSPPTAMQSGEGGTIAIAGGGTVTIQPDAIAIKSNGAMYSGTVNVYTRYIDPTASDIAEIIPGSFLGVNDAGDRVVLTSYGMVAVELETPAGESLQLAAGKKALLQLPIPVSIRSRAPQQLPLWHLNETTGIWEQEGIATRDGDAYRGEVSHFSFWNCDVPNDLALITMKITNGNGEALVNTLIRLVANNGAEGFGLTDSEGKVSGYVPSAQTLNLSAIAPTCYTLLYETTIGPFTGSVDIGEVIIPGNIIGVRLSGSLENCTNEPVTNGYVMVMSAGFTDFLPAGADGRFERFYPGCTNTTTFEVVGVDRAAQLQSSPVSTTGIAGIATAGTVTVCSSSSQAYVNYTIDGISYTINSNITDSIKARYYPLIVDNYTGLSYFTAHTPPGSNLEFQITFRHNDTEGTATNLIVNGDEALLIAPFSITLTNFPETVNEYYEGSFDGQYTLQGSPTVHVATGTFRIRRFN